MEKALLVIGDKKIDKRKPAPSFNLFVKHIEKQKDLEIEIINYRDVILNNLPDIKSPILTIMLFFPFEYWNKNIETYKKDSRIYGDRIFGEIYRRLFEKAGKILERKYRDKKIKYVNSPESSLLERDKKNSKRLFKKKNLPTPRDFAVKCPRDIQRLIGKGFSLYIKPRFGACGKGITYLNKDLMITNFLFRKGKVASRLCDRNWRFSKVKEKDRDRFLKVLLSKDFICEEAIEPMVFKGRRIDFRAYCVYGEIPYYYVRSMPEASPVTNWSQGGRIEKKKDFSRYISRATIKRVKSLTKRVSRELNLDYAGVDIIVSKESGKAYVLEAHSFPGYEKGFDLMDCLARKICALNRKTQ